MVVQAPGFLIVSEEPVKSDAVILFLGGEKGTREKEARRLIQEGRADYLLIPARSQVQQLDPSGNLIKLDIALTLNHLQLNTPQSGYLKPRPQDGSNQQTNEPTNRRYSSYSSPDQSNQLNRSNQWNRIIEDTHQEAIGARAMMESLGIRSAILVSAPYHMRRIKLIAGKVFGDDMAVSCVPTRYEPPEDGFWLFNGHDRKFVLTEYMKIAWFFVYSPFFVTQAE